jgi:uncharacterized membrane protein YkvI
MEREVETFWFPAKRYGWGWGPPVRWQGWAVLVVYALLLTAAAFVFLRDDRIAAFLLSSVVLTVLLLIVCWLKGERPRWRWGDR